VYNSDGQRWSEVWSSHSLSQNWSGEACYNKKVIVDCGVASTLVTVLSFLDSKVAAGENRSEQRSWVQNEDRGAKLLFCS
jgi:hypothetical protein